MPQIAFDRFYRYAELTSLLHALAHELCGGRWVATGGGGYALVDVVPRAWTHALAEMTGAAVDGPTPDSWHETVRRVAGRAGPAHLTDQRPSQMTEGEAGREAAVDEAVRRALEETRAAVPQLLGA